MQNELTHFSLFSGIGGPDLAAERAGFKTVGQCEKDPYCQRVLRKNFPGIPLFEDIKELSADTLGEAGIQCPTVLSGGFPCQPFSVAGKRKGKNDDRFLWPEMLRVVSELRPAWIIGENVAGFIHMELENALFDLENIEYETRTFVFPACAVGAWHRRDRCFIVAHTNSNRRHSRSNNIKNRSIQNTKERDNTQNNEKRSGRWNRIRQDGAVLSNADSARCKGYRDLQERGGEKLSLSGISGGWEAEPAVGRVVDGFPGRVDRLRCLGNAVVPQQVYPIFRAIADIERGNIIT